MISATAPAASASAATASTAASAVGHRGHKLFVGRLAYINDVYIEHERFSRQFVITVDGNGFIGYALYRHGHGTACRLRLKFHTDFKRRAVIELIARHFYMQFRIIFAVAVFRQNGYRKRIAGIFAFKFRFKARNQIAVSVQIFERSKPILSVISAMGQLPHAPTSFK